MTLLQRLMPGFAAYPDLHPMLVHFPAALFPAAFLFAFLALWRYPQMAKPARLTVFLGTLGALAAAATGLRAQELMPHGPGTLVAQHRTFMLVAGGIALILSIVCWRAWEDSSARARQVLVLGLLLLNGVVVLGADRGALVALRLRSGLDLHLPKVTAPPIVPKTTAAGGDSARGHQLYAKLECASCHGANRKIEAPGIPPTLEYAGSKMQRGWLVDYLGHPHRMRWVDEKRRPLLRMPNFELTADEAADLAAWLSARMDTTRFSANALEEYPLTMEAAQEGRGLVGQYACKGCHKIDGTGNDVGPPLDGVGDRLRPEYLVAFLKDPKGIIPGTPMKDFGLWEEEVQQLAAYLMTLKGGHEHKAHPEQ